MSDSSNDGVTTAIIPPVPNVRRTRQSLDWTHDERRAKDILRSRISQLTWGSGWAGVPKNRNKKGAVLDRLNGTTLNLVDGRLVKAVRPNDSTILAALRDQTDLFYNAAENPNVELTWLTIDMDIRDAGDALEACWAMEKHLCTAYPEVFGGLRTNLSTKGRGLHGTFTVSKRGCPSRRVVRVAKKLDRFLKLEKAKYGWRFQQVEVKGTCYSFDWHRFPDGRYEARNGKFGDLCRIPRLPTILALETAPSVRIDDLEGFLDAKFAEFRRDEPRDMRNVMERRKSAGGVPCGSAGKAMFDAETLAWVAEWLPAKFQAALQWPKSRTRILRQNGKDSGRWLYVDELALVAMLIVACTVDFPNPDGQVPTNRLKALWLALSEQGATKLKYSGDALIAARNVLSDYAAEDGGRLIDWSDKRYRQTTEVGGVSKPGYCCRFRATPLLVEFVRRPVTVTSQEDQPPASGISPTTPSDNIASYVRNSVPKLLQMPVSEWDRPIRVGWNTPTWAHNKDSTSEPARNGYYWVPRI